MNPTQLSRELRLGRQPDLNRRRWIIGLSFAGAALAKVVSLYQTGILKSLPDPPLDVFDSTKVDASDYAYKRLDTPDGLIMLANYAATAWVAGAGGENRAEQQPLLPIATSLKTLTDFGVAMKLTQEEWAENKALCFYCQLANVVSLASFALSLPETIRAIRSWQGQPDAATGQALTEEQPTPLENRTRSQKRKTTPVL